MGESPPLMTQYIDERAVMHDDNEPGGGSDAADYYYLLKDLYTVVGLAQANGHEVERYIYDAYHPQIKAMSYWHENFDSTNLRIDSSPEALSAYQSGVSHPALISQSILSD